MANESFTWLTKEEFLSESRNVSSNEAFRSQENLNRTLFGQDALSIEAFRSALQGSSGATVGATNASMGRFDINSFRSEIKEGGILQTHSYIVALSPFRSGSPTTQHLSKFTSGSESTTMVMRCDTATLPAIRLNVDENVRRYGYGPVERVAHSVQFNEFNLSWVVDADAKIVDFFNSWMNCIVNYQSSSGGNTINSTRQNGSVTFSSYEVGYKDDYSNPMMSIFVYDKANDKVIEYRIYDIFPTAINEVTLGWGDENQQLKYNVSFVFTDLEVVTPKSATSSGLVNILRRLGSVVNEDKSTTKTQGLNYAVYTKTDTTRIDNIKTNIA